ncbi:MAG: metal-dependent hydrolase [Longimicrobiales bacterium]
MPTPAGHSLAGLAVHLVAGTRPVSRPALVAACLVVLANLPDIDFVPGYLIGQPREFHWGPTHSLFAAILAGLGFGLLAGRWLGGFRTAFLLATAAYGSHIILDLLLGPAVGSRGLQVLWPLSGTTYMAPWSVFHMFPASVEQIGPIRTLFSRGILPLIVREAAVMIPVCLAAWVFGWRGWRPTQTRHTLPDATIARRDQHPLESS